jgi:hypothetical protein
MNDEERIAQLLRDEAETTYSPRPDGWAGIQKRISHRRRARLAKRVGAPLLVAAAAVAIALPLATGSESGEVQNLHIVPPAHLPATTLPRPTVPSATAVPTTAPATSSTTVPPTTTSTVPLAGAAAALNAYVAADRTIVVHSGPVRDGAAVVAVAGTSTPSGGQPSIYVLNWDGQRWSKIASVVVDPGGPHWDFAVGVPVSVADLTGDGRPDFLLIIAAADNGPGVILSQDGAGGGWRLIPNSGFTPTYVLLARDPVIQGNRLVSYYNDCTPNCAMGHTTPVHWTYQRSSGNFVPVNPPTTVPPG